MSADGLKRWAFDPGTRLLEATDAQWCHVADVAFTTKGGAGGGGGGGGGDEDGAASDRGKLLA